MGKVTRNGAALSTDEVGGFLTDLYGAPVEGVARLLGGEWSTAFSFAFGSEELVVRFSAHKEDFEKDRLAATFATRDLPVPRVLDVGESVLGYFAISEREHGVFLEELDEEGWHRVLPSLLASLDSMRMTEAEPGSGSLLAHEGSEKIRWRDYLLCGIADLPGSRVSGWREKLSRSVDLESLFSEGETAFRSSLESVPEIRSLVHGDLINRNVLVDPDRSRIVAVFDWGCGAFGDYLYDLAWLDFWAPWFPALMAVDPLGAVRSHYRSIGHRVSDFDTRLRAYELHIALTHLGYNAFTGRDNEQIRLSHRLREVLEGT